MSNNQTVKNLRVKNSGTSVSQVLPIGADAVNVELANRRNLQETIGNIDSRTDGSITNNLEVLSSAIQTLDNIKADTAMIGSPLVAGTASEMVDPDHIYVYTGNETGYTSGNWYYYDGSSWTSGGVYNSTAVETDKTLQIVNVAADAQATGKMIVVSEAQPAAASNKLWIDLNAQEVAIPTMDDFNTLSESIAESYSSNKVYELGDYCIYNNQLYKCTINMTEAQSWTVGHWTAIKIMNQIEDIIPHIIIIDAIENVLSKTWKEIYNLQKNNIIYIRQLLNDDEDMLVEVTNTLLVSNVWKTHDIEQDADNFGITVLGAIPGLTAELEVRYYLTGNENGNPVYTSSD